MAAAQEIQAGVLRLLGIPGALAITGTAIPNANANYQSVNWSQGAKIQRLTSQDGVTIAGLAASERTQKLQLKFFPAGANLEAARVIVKLIQQTAPLTKLTIAGFGTGAGALANYAEYNHTWNYMGDAGVENTPEGWTAITLNLEAYEVAATGGTFAGLDVITP